MKSNKEGVERVLKEDGQYAFMMESTVVDYVVERQVWQSEHFSFIDNNDVIISVSSLKLEDFLITKDTE